MRSRKRTKLTIHESSEEYTHTSYTGNWICVHVYVCMW